MKGTALLLLAAALAVVLRRASAASRHLVWTLALGAELALPVLALTLPAWQAPVFPPTPTVTMGGPLTARGDSVAVAQNPQAVPANAARLPADAAWSGLLLLSWGIGPAFFVGRMAVGEIRVRRLASSFSFPAVPAGRYQLEIAKPGFVRKANPVLERKPSGTLHEDVALDVGDVTQNITVTGHRLAGSESGPHRAPRRIRVGGHVTAPKLTKIVKPVYPASAKEQGIQGTILLRALIGADGRIITEATHNVLTQRWLRLPWTQPANGDTSRRS